MKEIRLYRYCQGIVVLTGTTPADIESAYYPPDQYDLLNLDFADLFPGSSVEIDRRG